MRVPLFIVAGFAIFIQLASTCNPTWYCGRQCYSYRNDSVTICQTGPGNAAAFTKSADSLNQLYGAGTPSFADSVTVSGSSSNATNSIVNQLENQGYACNSD